MNFFNSWHHLNTTTKPYNDDDDDDDDKSDHISTATTSSDSSASTSSSSSLCVSSSHSDESLSTSSTATDDFDTVRVICQQEQNVYKKNDPLKKQRQRVHIEDRNPMNGDMNDDSSNDDIVDEICRTKMCEWSYQIVDFCHFHRESVDIAMNYLDRTLCTEYGQTTILHDRNIYQMVAMTCLYSAIKIHERQALSPNVVSQLSRNVYSAQQIMDMEITLLHLLQWQLHPPTAYSFVRELITALPNDYIPNEATKEFILEITQKETELAVSDYRFIEIPMSTIAYCSIMNALHCCSEGTTKTFTDDLIGNISTMMASAIGLIHPSSDDILEVQRMLFTVCPITTTGNDSDNTSSLSERECDPLDYSTSSSMNDIMEEEVDVITTTESKRYPDNCDVVQMKTKQRRTTTTTGTSATFDISPRSSFTTSTVAASEQVLV